MQYSTDQGANPTLDKVFTQHELISSYAGRGVILGSLLLRSTRVVPEWRDMVKSPGMLLIIWTSLCHDGC
jgi:hypothetical protein